MAKVIMKTKPLFRPIEIDSRGLVVLFSQPINQKAEAVLISNGYSAKGHASTAFSSEDLQEGNLILTMEEAQRVRSGKSIRMRRTSIPSRSFSRWKKRWNRCLENR